MFKNAKVVILPTNEKVQITFVKHIEWINNRL